LAVSLVCCNLGGQREDAMELPERDVIVVGAGNAATCAALSAAETGLGRDDRDRPA